MASAGIRTALKELLRRLGIEVRRVKHVNSEETVLAKLLTAVRPVAVLDVGANVGQFAELIRNVGFAGPILSFEALPEVHSALSMASARDPAWVVAPCAALGSEKGSAQIHISRNSVSSSLLDMLETHVDAAPDSAYVGTQTIRVERLDELAPPLLPTHGQLMLKIDTQGYEREVLKGATGLLGRVASIQVEISLVPLYAGAPTLTEMVSYIEGLGYELFSLVPGFRDARSGRLLQMDGFFIRGS